MTVLSWSEGREREGRGMGGGARTSTCSSEWETVGRVIGRGLKVVVGGAVSGADLMGAGVTSLQPYSPSTPIV